MPAFLSIDKVWIDLLRVLSALVLAVIPIHLIEVVHGSEDQQQGDQCPAQLARNAGLDLQAHQRARAQAAQ